MADELPVLDPYVAVAPETVISPDTRFPANGPILEPVERLLKSHVASVTGLVQEDGGAGGGGVLLTVRVAVAVFPVSKASTKR